MYLLRFLFTWRKMTAASLFDPVDSHTQRQCLLDLSRTKKPAFSSLYSIHEVAGRANDKEVSDILKLFVSILFLALASLQAQGADDPKIQAPRLLDLGLIDKQNAQRPTP